MAKSKVAEKAQPQSATASATDAPTKAPKAKRPQKAAAKGKPRKTAKKPSAGRPKLRAATVQKPIRKPQASRRGRRHTPAERARILATASRESLSGAMVAKRFGISALTYYNWRKKGGTKVSRPGRRRSATRQTQGGSILEMIRSEVRRRMAEIMPAIMNAEIDATLSGIASRPRRSRETGGN